MTLRTQARRALRDWKLYFFILPSLVMILVFSYFPAASAVYHSFFDWQGGEAKQLVGWSNFRRAMTDTTLWGSFLTVACLVVFNLVKMVPSVAMAVVLHRLRSER
jgi:ABC-type sugar transport system permease subunit